MTTDSWRFLHLVGTVIGAGALIAYGIVWYVVLLGGGVARFSPATTIGETVIEPILLLGFIVLLVVSFVRQVKEWRDERMRG